MIKFHKVSKTFKNKKVLEEITFSIEGGEFVTLVGPSGAGKSTIIHVLLGAEKSDEGDILVDDFHINKMNEHELQDFRRKVGVVFQNDHLLPHKTVEENVAFALQVCGFHKAYTEHRTNEVLEMVGLTGAESNFPGELSGGERQKAAIARALTTQPHLFIADEPTGNLDPKSAEDVIEILKMINKNGTTVILATHNKGIVDGLQRRVISLKNGKIDSDHVGGYSA